WDGRSGDILENAGRSIEETAEVAIGKEADLMSSIRRDCAHDFLSPERLLPGREAEENFDRGATLSIVIPSRDEAGNLPRLVEEIILAFRPLAARPSGSHRLDAFEVVVVDDGSKDGTRSVLGQLSEIHPELRPIFL